MSHPRRTLLITVMLLLAVGLLSNALFAAPPNRIATGGDDLQRQSNGQVKVHPNNVTGTARFVEAGDGYLTAEFAGQDAESAARGFLTRYGNLFGITDAASQLKTTGVETDNLGMTHVRFAQTYGGFSVFGADIIVHINKDGSIATANGMTVAAEALAAVNTQVTLGQADANSRAAGELAATRDARTSESSLVLLNPGLITDQASGTSLAYRIRVDSASQPHLAKWVFVDAQSGEVRFSYPAVYESRNRRTYNLRRTTNYGGATLVRTEGQGPVTSATSCTTADINNAHDYAGNTYDFYYSRYGRDSYNNAGAALDSYVCYSTNYQNAFWDGTRMTYGDGFAAADDVVSHELTHGVTEYASGLIYSNQSGALNESYSDIFGEAVDLTNGAGTDTSAVRWDMGEDIPGIGAIRDMADPGRFGDADRTNSSNYYCGSGDNGGVHINSGVPNKAYTLLVDGGTFNGQTVTAIGLDAASAINYRTNEVYLTGSSKMLDNYNFLIRSCGDLYGAGSSTCQEVRDAVEAVRMNGSICGSGGATATPGGGGPTPTPGGGGGQTYTGTLSGTGASQYRPDPYYYVSSSGSHTGALTGPSGTDFDLYLQKWNGSAWANVRSGTGSTSTENVSYSGTAGYYRWRIYSYSGSGNYTLVTTRPASLLDTGIAPAAPSNLNDLNPTNK